jgi:hypothetical protein
MRHPQYNILLAVAEDMNTKIQFFDELERRFVDCELTHLFKFPTLNYAIKREETIEHKYLYKNDADGELYLTDEYYTQKEAEDFNFLQIVEATARMRMMPSKNIECEYEYEYKYKYCDEDGDKCISEEYVTITEAMSMGMLGSDIIIMENSKRVRNKK